MSITEFTSADMIPGEYKKIGNLVAEGSTVDDVTASLAAKAEAKGADAFKVIAVTGNNRLRGNAIIYKKE